MAPDEPTSAPVTISRSFDSMKPVAAAAQPGRIRLDDGQYRRDGDGGIERVAALLENPVARFGSERMRARDRRLRRCGRRADAERAETDEGEAGAPEGPSNTHRRELE